MKISINREQLRFYLWVGLAWTILWLLHYLVTDTENFFARASNEIWRNVYLITVNFFFFGYAWPFTANGLRINVNGAMKVISDYGSI